MTADNKTCDCCGDVPPVKHEPIVSPDGTTLPADFLCEECLDVYVEEEKLEAQMRLAEFQADNILS